MNGEIEKDWENIVLSLRADIIHQDFVFEILNVGKKVFLLSVGSDVQKERKQKRKKKKNLNNRQGSVNNADGWQK